MGSDNRGQDIAVHIAKIFKPIDVSLSKLRRLVKAVCDRFDLSKATVSIAIVDDAEIRKVNKRFLNRNCATDCLSFDLSTDEEPSAGFRKIAGVNHDGVFSKSFELVVNGEKAAKEANSRGHSPEAELALYVTHSLLHNLGFDDSSRDKAKEMHQAEDEILQQFGYGLVFSTGGS
jgi:rRNA maturation RNase YbeY